MKKYAIIVAGGKGTRMGSGLPKQFLLLDDKPVLMHTIEAFYLYDNEIEIIVVLPEEQIDYWNELKEEYDFDIGHRVAVGGATRFQSVKNGLKWVKHESLVAIHDGVRPLVTPGLIRRTFEIDEKEKGVYPALPVSDTLRRWASSPKTYRQVDRERYRLAQTPQVFHSDILLHAYDTFYSEEFTDDVSVVEKAYPHARIKAIEGLQDNIKITRPEDLIIASALLKWRT